MYFYYTVNHIGGVIVSVFDQSEVACELKPRSGQTKTYQINICCFSSKTKALTKGIPKNIEWVIVA
jgi:hypothetical protein